MQIYEDVKIVKLRGEPLSWFHNASQDFSTQSISIFTYLLFIRESISCINSSMAFSAQAAYAELHEEFAQQQLIASEEREARSHRSDGNDEARG